MDYFVFPTIILFVIQAGIAATVTNEKICKDFPLISYSWHRSDDNGNPHHQLKVSILEGHEPKTCTFKNEEGTSFNGTKIIEDQHSTPYFLLDITDKPEKLITEKWELSINYGYFSVNALITEKTDSHQKANSSFVWNGIQRKQYVKRGGELKVKCVASRRLNNCTLIDPNGKIFIQAEGSKGIMKNLGNGCVMTVKNADINHTGNWTCDMDFEGRKVKSLVPVFVLESYLIPEIERTSSKNCDLKLHCRTLSTIYYEKIKFCEWIHPNGEQVFISDNSTKYSAVREDHVCSLELKGSTNEDFGTWKCIAHLNGDSKDEVYATIRYSNDSQIIESSYPVEQIPEIDICEFSDESAKKSTQMSESIIFVLLLIIFVFIQISSTLMIYYCKKKRCFQLKF